MRRPTWHFCCAAFVAAALLTVTGARGADDWQPCETARVEHGDLTVLFRDNSQSPAVLSGADALFNRRDAPDFDAFDPDSPGSSAGLNFEHIIAGHASPNNRFMPRHHRYVLERATNRPAVRLMRDQRDDPWLMSSTLTYTLVAPHYVDLDFRCRAHDPALFGPRGYAVLFFANYMHDVERVALNFLGHETARDTEHWIAADAPPGHADYNGGGTYRFVDAVPLEYDADHDFKLNVWSYDWPRFSRSFYWVQAAHGMTMIMMFDKTTTPRDEIRFSLFKFKVPKFPRPACDWQYVIHKVEAEQEYGFRAVRSGRNSSTPTIAVRNTTAGQPKQTRDVWLRGEILAVVVPGRRRPTRIQGIGNSNPAATSRDGEHARALDHQLAFGGSSIVPNSSIRRPAGNPNGIPQAWRNRLASFRDS